MAIPLRDGLAKNNGLAAFGRERGFYFLRKALFGKLGGAKEARLPHGEGFLFRHFRYGADEVVHGKHLRNEQAGNVGNEGFLNSARFRPDNGRSRGHGFYCDHSEILIFRHEERRDGPCYDSRKVGIVFENAEFDIRRPVGLGDDVVLLGIVHTVNNEKLLIGHRFERANHRVHAFERGEFRKRNVVVAFLARLAGNEFARIHRRIKDFRVAPEMFFAVSPEVFAVHVDPVYFGEVAEKSAENRSPNEQVRPP